MVRSKLNTLLAVFCFTLCLNTSVNAENSESDIYAGKHITILIGYAAGGTYDMTARLLSRHMGNHIPGNPIFLPQNLPGSGGIKTILNLYSVAPRDGTSLGMLPRSYALEPAFNPETARYDPKLFIPIGSTSKEVSVGVVWSTKKISNVRDLYSKQITVGATGATDDTGRFPTLFAKLSGAKIKVITGYPGGNDITMAMEKGEVDGRFGWSWGSLKSRSHSWLDEHKIDILVQMGMEKAQDLPNVPLIMDFAKTDIDRKALEFLFTPQVTAWPLVAPPAVADDKIKLLRHAFDETMKDQAFIDDAGKVNIEIDPVTGQVMQNLITRITSFDKNVVDRALQLSEVN